MEVSQSADRLLAALSQDIQLQIPLLVPSPVHTAGDQHPPYHFSFEQTHNSLLREQINRQGLNTFCFAV